MELTNPQFAQSDVARILGADPDTIQNWANRKIVSAPASAGRGRARLYTAAQVVGFGWLKALADFGIPPTVAREMVSEMDFAAQLAHGPGYAVIRRAPKAGGWGYGENPWSDAGVYGCRMCNASDLPAALVEAGSTAIIVNAGQIQASILKRIEDERQS